MAGSSWRRARRVRAEPALDLAGLHSHIGSQIFGLVSFGTAAERMVAFLRAVECEHGVTIGLPDLGGSLGVPYPPGEKDAPAHADLAEVLHTAAPDDVRIALEPGRSIVGATAVAVYEVGTVKGRYVSADGGMSDNPRPATYGAKYTTVLASRASDAAPGDFIVVGKHCETGDVLADGIVLPRDVRPGKRKRTCSASMSVDVLQP
ncbi:diaminopimelate decarboxylase family protein [Streptomyces sp. MMS24-I31]|uniref:diaminopimelate decarboxylase family protein n=1 Tax=Streptomyces sp. MMS24-I31 TaxID=3351563 RepID=UPI003896D3C4